MSSRSIPRDPYLKSVVDSSQLLSAFRSSGEALPLREISLRSGLPKAMVFRLLYTLEKWAMVEKIGENLYVSCLWALKQKLYRIPCRITRRWREDNGIEARADGSHSRERKRCRISLPAPHPTFSDHARR
jgi:hypothetical protein